MLPSVSLLLAAAVGTSAHYTFPKVWVNSGTTADWQYVRKADNWQNNGFVDNVNSNQIRCFQSSHSPAQSTLSVAAGTTITYGAAPNVYHPGPMQFYLARVPDGQDINSWTGEGAVWFKIYHEQPTFGSQLTWASNGKSSFPVKIPSCIKSGNYLLRAEHIGLHVAQSSGAAQFYISCAQLSVTGGGSTEPGSNYKVSFPGAYKASDPGILININYPVPTSYKNPGPSVFTC
ncbi:glycoside hydrolase [Copromyces sp. CBS 386.78]|uniref:lytic cellulose monooxygenase (C4-dehydrogenating) n=1 Tax=Pseudoneurospora amorphoporcata TaxID=241081 RepID=A0AAN6NJX5_9PEZI|nr:glycoside hydrolase [Copromyces sp. CBS 386.78]KAK3947197.1 glycoside hydrolase [Pseudoneurospora amorphoporcata]